MELKHDSILPYRRVNLRLSHEGYQALDDYAWKNRLGKAPAAEKILEDFLRAAGYDIPVTDKD